MTTSEQARLVLRGLVRAMLQTNDVGRFIRLRRIAFEKRLYTREITLSELRASLIRLGFERGRVVWVQSSWNEFYNYHGRPSELIALMRDLLGPEGTLVMPAFPLDQDPAKVLEIDIVPSSTGLLTEVFRRGKDVKRSIHLTSSVCAAGPAADFLLNGHHKDIFPWGPRSPYCRLLDVDARLVGLGMGPLVTNLTPLHAVECLLYDEVQFFRQVFDGKVAYHWRRRSGEEGDHEFMWRIGRISPSRYGRHFPKDSYTRLKLSNVDMVAVNARTLMARALELGRMGITVYDKRSVMREAPMPEQD